MMQKILIVLVIGLQFHSLQAQDTTLTREELRVMASESFAKSDYTSASVYYKRLLDYYPKDPSYHFYLGACKEEAGEELVEATRLLEFASVRFSPQEVYYYLGAAYQKQAEFEKAMVAYNQYIDKATKKDIAHRQVELRIKECKSGQKLITKDPVVQTSIALPEKTDTSKEGIVKPEAKPKEMVKLEREKPVIFPPKTTADESGYMEMLNEALRIQMKSDSLVREAERLRREIAESTDWIQKKKTLAEINILQTEADNLQNNANAIYSKARGLELKFVHSSYKAKNPKIDTIPANQSKKEKLANSVKTESSKTELKQKEVPKDKILPEFEVLDKSPYSASNPIPIDTINHSGICYKIQVGVFSKPVDYKQFRGLSPLSAEKIIENGFTRYYAGIFSNIKETELSLEKVRNYGFREAFIVSFYNGKKISLIRAREIEQMLKTN
jgi:tetratricopeptide (TPR) repeat protein